MKTTEHTKQVGADSDRGLIKWQGMLLTEHVRLVKAFYEEQEQMPKPELTEFDTSHPGRVGNRHESKM